MAAVIALLLSLAGPVVYALTMDEPFLRRTGLVAYVLLGLGAILGVMVAWKRGGLWRKALAAIEILLLAAFAYGFESWARLPGDPRFEQLAQAPAVELVEAEGRRFPLAEATARGPVLLVFFRGHW